MNGGDEPIALTPKIFDTLLYLVSHSGQVIEKDELMSSIWPDTIVEENNLNKNISVLRHVLGENPGEHRYIVTVPGKGYKFVASVVESSANEIKFVDIANADITLLRSGPSRATSRSKKSAFAAIGVIALVAALALSYTYFFSHRSINSIAVMPFVNETPDAELEELSDGMTETLITSLRKVPNLEVQARSIVFRYKGKDSDARTIGTDLNVQAVLYGWIVRRADDFTLKVELVDAKTGNRLWEDSYNGKMSNLIEIQREAARDLVSNLRIKLSGSTEQKLAKNYRENVEAYTLFVRGQSFVRKLTRQDIRTGIGYLERAKDIDPSYTLAYVGLAEAYRALAMAGEMPPGEVLPKAKEAAIKAVQIDDTFAEAHSSLGATLCYDWNWPEAEKHLLRGLELDPNSYLAHFAYAHFLNSMRGPEEARAEFDRAQKLEPFDAYINAPAANRSEHPEEAINRIRITIDLDPNFYFARVLAAGIYRTNGMYAESIAESRLAKTLAPDQTWSDIGLISTLVQMGRTDEARLMLDEILRLSQTRYVPPYNIALAYNQLRETDKAFVFLEESYKTRGTRLTFLKSEPRWNNLRNDPRFQDILRRVGI